MTQYELQYSKFLADISQKVVDFIKNNYPIENINKNSVYNEVTENNESKTENDVYDIDNTKVELIDYVPEQDFNIKDLLKNKTLWYIIGAIFLYKLLRK